MSQIITFIIFTLLNSPSLIHIIISIKLWYQRFALNVRQASAVLTSVVCVVASAALLCCEDEDRGDRAEPVWPGGVQGAEEGWPHHRWSLHHPRQGRKG